MPLPALIEIVPLPKPVRAELTVPGSKSITNRALLLAALADSTTTLHGALWSEDTQVMVECLQRLGFDVTVKPDPTEISNRTLIVKGLNGQIPNSGRAHEPLELFVGNAGTAARFLAAFVCLGQGAYRLHGAPRMHERPQAGLFAALRALGYRVESADDRLPAIIHGAGPQAGACCVSVEESSQFASALLLSAQAGNWRVQVTGEDPEESPYIAMTAELVRAFPRHGGHFHIEPDASSGSYFWAAGWLWPARQMSSGGEGRTADSRTGDRSDSESSLGVEAPSCLVRHWPSSSWQIDAQFPRYLPLPVSLSRRSQLGDSIMTAMILAPFAVHPVRFVDLGRLRVQECERVHAMRTELTKCGAKVREEGDTLKVFPSPLHGAEIETYDDHRIAMCFAILGLKAPGIRIKNPTCVRKTFPSFFQKLAAPPPDGLGAGILDVATGRLLRGDELFAD